MKIDKKNKKRKKSWEGEGNCSSWSVILANIQICTHASKSATESDYMYLSLPPYRLFSTALALHKHTKCVGTCYKHSIATPILHRNNGIKKKFYEQEQKIFADFFKTGRI